jgi:phosphoglycerate dehydrogenase-like enzyme
LFSERHWKRLSSIGEIVRNEWEGPPDDAAIGKLMEGADAVVTSWGSPPLAKPLLDRAPNLRAVIHAAGSVKKVATPELWERGIRVSSGNDALAVGVAETALGLTIASLKNMWELTRQTRQGGWSKGRGQVRELYEIAVGVIGGGRAGQHYIRLLRQFAVDVYVYDPVLEAKEIEAMGANKTDLETLLATCDVISIHAPSLPSTYRMINKERLALMKDDAILINTARGSIVDEEALAEELGKGRLLACLDVTDPEPPVADHPLRQLPNCIITPHIAGAVNNGVRRLGQFAVEELERLKEGLPLQGEVRQTQLAVLA